MQCDCGSSHQEVRTVSPFLGSGLALYFAWDHGMWWKWCCQFWALLLSLLEAPGHENKQQSLLKAERTHGAISQGCPAPSSPSQPIACVYMHVRPSAAYRVPALFCLSHLCVCVCVCEHVHLYVLTHSLICLWVHQFCFLLNIPFYPSYSSVIGIIYFSKCLLDYFFVDSKSQLKFFIFSAV